MPACDHYLTTLFRYSMWLTVTLQYYWDNTFDEKCEIIFQYTLDNEIELTSHEIMLSDSVHKLAFLSI